MLVEQAREVLIALLERCDERSVLRNIGSLGALNVNVEGAVRLHSAGRRSERMP